MAAIIRKDLHELVEICNRCKGRVCHEKTALSILGYSRSTRFWNTNAQYLARYVVRKRVQFGEWVLSEKELSVRYPKIQDKWWFHYFPKEKLYLYPKESVPWWMLKEYGGNL